MDKDWIQLRKKLYRHARNEVLLRLGREGLKSYEEAYASEFRSSWSPCSKKDFLLALTRSDIILLGDFHALRQSQRSHLRILKAIFNEGRPKRNITLFVEFVESQYQQDLDLYLNRKISEKSFLKRIGWGKRWGFPWEHYQPLLEFAQEKGIKVVAINKHYSSRSMGTLRARDRFMAKQISSHMSMGLAAKQKNLFVVIVGDLHIASPHLPLEISSVLEKKPKISRVFQNSEKIYFKLAEAEKENRVDLVQISKSDFCVLSVPPWVKWHSYLMYLEESFDFELQEDGIDPTDNVVAFAQVIEKGIGLNINYADFSVYMAGDPIFLNRMQQKLSRQAFMQVKLLVSQERSFYIPELKAGYLSRLSVNQAAALAGEYLHALVSERQRLFISGEKDFYKMIWQEAVAYFFSKLINHKRKVDSYEDIQVASALGQSKSSEFYLLVLQQRVRELAYLAGQKAFSTPPLSRSRSGYGEAARLLGGMMGERLYNGYQAKRITKSFLRKVLSYPADEKDFISFYLEMLELVESLPKVKSKTQRF